MLDWKGAYHAILGYPAYAKFMAVLNYTYLKPKLPGPNGVITVSGSFEQAYFSSREHFDLAATAANSVELGHLCTTTTECHPDLGKPSQAPTFIPTEETKPVVIDDDNSTVGIS